MEKRRNVETKEVLVLKNLAQGGPAPQHAGERRLEGAVIKNNYLHVVLIVLYLLNE